MDIGAWCKMAALTECLNISGVRFSNCKVVSIVLWYCFNYYVSEISRFIIRFQTCLFLSFHRFYINVAVLRINRNYINCLR